MVEPKGKKQKQQRKRPGILSLHHREGHLAAQRGFPRKRARCHGGAHAQ